MGTDFNSNNLVNSIKASQAKFDPKKRTIYLAGQFDKPMGCDIDGDGINDDIVTHDDLIRRSLKNKGYNIAPFSNGEMLAFAEKVANGEIQVKEGDILNASFGASILPTIEEIKDLFPDLNLTKENLEENREAIFSGLQAKIDNGDLNSTEKKISLNDLFKVKLPIITKSRANWALKTDQAIKKLQDKGVIVVNSGGNSGENYINWGFIGADHMLSATNAQGNTEIYSADNGLTEIAQGTYGVRKVVDPKTGEVGYSVDGDTIPEYMASELSGGPSIVEKYRGQKAKDVVLKKIPQDMLKARKDLTQNECRELIKEKAPDKLIPLIDWEAFNGQASPERVKIFKEAIRKNEMDEQYITADGKFVFTKGKNGEIVYDPDKSGNPDQVSVISGTSFSPLDFIPKCYPADLKEED